MAGLLLGACGTLLGLSGQRRARVALERLARLEAARERDARRARLTAVLEPEIVVRWYLTIRNEGDHPAQHFTVSIDGRPLEQSPMVDPIDLDPGRLGMVAPHGLLRIPLRTRKRPDKLQLELSWSDGSQDLCLYRAELTD